MNINQLKCPNCGADLIPNGSNYVQCGFCNSTYSFDSNNQALIKVNNTNIGTSNIGASNVVINNYYAAPNTVQNNQMPINFSGFSGGVSPKSRTVASALCIIFGYVGGHQFYAGRTGLGVLYLFTAGLCGIGWIVDIVRTLSGTFTDSNNLPISNW